MPMIDVSCRTCRRRYGYRGEPKDCPPCPRCGVQPDPRHTDHDQAVVDEFREWLREWKDRKTFTRPQRVRVAAGLTGRQAATLLGVTPAFLAAVEAGREPLGPDLAAKMADVYGIAPAEEN